MTKIENLKKNKCPFCGGELNWNKFDEVLECECGYSLTREQFSDYIDEIIASEFHFPDVDENFRRLNKL